MTVVSDSSPINYLCLISAIDVLPALFTETLITPTVHQELSHTRAPKAVADWLQKLPPWVRVQAPTSLQIGLSLDAGETEAISLALELNLPAILIDEKLGRRSAMKFGLQAIGTLSILVAAEAHHLNDLESALTRLIETNFHVEAATVHALIERARASQASAILLKASHLLAAPVRRRPGAGAATKRFKKRAKRAGLTPDGRVEWVLFFMATACIASAVPPSGVAALGPW